jgi:hypothetical protein
MSNISKRRLVSILRKAGIISQGPVTITVKGYEHGEETIQGQDRQATPGLAATSGRPARPRIDADPGA